MALASRRAWNANPAMLRWARENAALTPEEVAKKLFPKAQEIKEQKIKEQKIIAFEDGSESPTRVQLGKLAATYRRPVSVFYMTRPPAPTRKGVDFRAPGVGSEAPKMTAMLNALIRDVRARQSLVTSLLEDDEETSPLSLNGSLSQDMAAPAAARIIRRRLFGENDEGAKWAKDKDKVFGENLRPAVERQGVFVVLMGDIGSYHTDIPTEVFRGFAIADDTAPFVVINDNDASAAWAFTLLHEFVHVCVGGIGLSGPPRTDDVSTPEARTERFCNDVASEFLLPAEKLERYTDDGVGMDDAAVLGLIKRIATEHPVSEPLVAYRLWRGGHIDVRPYERLRRHYRKRWEDIRQKRRDHGKSDRGKKGPHPDTVRRHRLGPALVGLVKRSLAAETLSHTKAGIILGVNPGKVGRLLEGA